MACRPGREHSPETKPCSSFLISDFQISDLSFQNGFSCLSPSVWYLQQLEQAKTPYLDFKANLVWRDSCLSERIIILVKA